MGSRVFPLQGHYFLINNSPSLIKVYSSLAWMRGFIVTSINISKVPNRNWEHHSNEAMYTKGTE